MSIQLAVIKWNKETPEFLRIAMDVIVEEIAAESNGADNKSSPTQDKPKPEEKPQGNCYW